MSDIEEDVKILNNFCEYEDAVVLTDYALTLAQEAIINILAEREQKDKRIQELEEENHIQRKQLNDAFDRGFIPKQVVIDKINEINKAYEDSKDENGESPYYYPDYAVRVLQEFLGGEK